MNSTEELYLVTLKRDWKFEKKLTCDLQNYMRNLANFDPTLQNIHICTLMGSFWPKYIILGSKIAWGIWWTSLEHSKILKFAFWETFLSKVHNVWGKKLQKSYVSWHWTVMQYLKKNWLVVWKMTWGIWCEQSQIWICALWWARFVQSI